MSSIQRRLSLGLLVSLFLVGLILVQSAIWLFDLGLRRYFEQELRDETSNLLVAMTRRDQQVFLDKQRINPAYERQYSGHYFLIKAGDDAHPWRSRSLWDTTLPDLPEQGMSKELVHGPRRQKLLIYRADYRRYHGEIQIMVARDYTPVLRSFNLLQRVGLGVGVGGLLLILVIQAWTVRRSLRPLEQVRRQIGQLQEGERTELDARVPDELQPLVEQINHLLSFTEDSLKRSRNALGNLGHALKTPLAVLMSLTAREELKALPDLRKTLSEQLELIEQRLSRELGRARLASEVLPGAYFTCSSELPTLFETLGIIHGSRLQLSQEVTEGLRLPWNREDVLELLGNLLDNSCKWARSRVSLHIEEREQGFLIRVEDDGPGIPADRYEDVLNRGTRLDEQVAGHGLGLGIVRDIVNSWQGRLTLGRSPLGGLQVEIWLPRAGTRHGEETI